MDNQQKYQEWFNKGVAGVASQGWKHSTNGSCRYRDREGRKCLIGWLIPDSLYSPDFEGVSVSDVIGPAALEEAGAFLRKKVGRFQAVFDFLEMKPEDYRFLVEFQQCHDTSVYSGKEILRKKLAVFAIKWNLDIPKELVLGSI